MKIIDILKSFLSLKLNKTVNKPSKTIINEKLYTIDREKQPLLFNKSPNKYPMGMK